MANELHLFPLVVVVISFDRAHRISHTVPTRQPHLEFILVKQTMIKLRIDEDEKKRIQEYARKRETTVAEVTRRYYRRLTAGDMKK